jgi:hypothetical protein
MDLNSVVDVLTKNSVQFLSIVKLLEYFPPNSLLVGFSGGGVGGHHEGDQGDSGRIHDVLLSSIQVNRRRIRAPRATFNPGR